MSRYITSQERLEVDILEFLQKFTQPLTIREISVGLSATLYGRGEYTVAKGVHELLAKGLVAGRRETLEEKRVRFGQDPYKSRGVLATLYFAGSDVPPRVDEQLINGFEATVPRAKMVTTRRRRKQRRHHAPVTTHARPTVSVPTASVDYVVPPSAGNGAELFDMLTRIQYRQAEIQAELQLIRSLLVLRSQDRQE
jgi:hypothetical protein